MQEGLSFLLPAAVVIGFLHTLAGPDHYLPFVAMSKTGGWSTAKTMYIVIAGGLLHVFSSVLIGFIGIAAGIAVSKITLIEGFRGDIAAWLLLLFGAVYTLWAVFHLYRHQSHSHPVVTPKARMTYWVLFTIFVFGPCEPLIPLLMYPAAKHSYGAVALISLVFAMVTISTMTAITFFLLKGMQWIQLPFLEKYQHLIAGLTLCLCGAGILFAGL